MPETVEPIEQTEPAAQTSMYTDVKNALTDFFSQQRQDQIQEDNSVSVLDGLDAFFQNYFVKTADGYIQIFQSFTYGEMLISTLLLCILLVMVFKWFWEVLR